MIEALWRSARQSWRGLVRDRGFALTAIMVLAMGIGTSTGILSMARAVLAQALPYPHGERLVQLFEIGLKRPEHFWLGHVVVGDVVLACGVLLIWGAWLSWVGPTEDFALQRGRSGTESANLW